MYNIYLCVFLYMAPQKHILIHIQQTHLRAQGLQPPHACEEGIAPKLLAG